MRRSLTYDDLIGFAGELEGETLETVTGKAFSVGVSRNGEVFFTPASSGRGQSDGRKAAERFLERYNATGSLRPADYGDVSRNASYLIGLMIRSTTLDQNPPKGRGR